MHVYLHCPLLQGARGLLRPAISYFQKAMLQFGPKSTLLTEEEAVRWVHTGRPEAVGARQIRAGRALREEAMRFHRKARANTTARRRRTTRQQANESRAVTGGHKTAPPSHTALNWERERRRAGDLMMNGHPAAHVCSFMRRKCAEARDQDTAGAAAGQLVGRQADSGHSSGATSGQTS